MESVSSQTVSFQLPTPIAERVSEASAELRQRVEVAIVRTVLEESYRQGEEDLHLADMSGIVLGGTTEPTERIRNLRDEWES